MKLDNIVVLKNKIWDECRLVFVDTFERLRQENVLQKCSIAKKIGGGHLKHLFQKVFVVK